MSTNPYSKKWFHAAMDDFERLVKAGHIHVNNSGNMDREPKELARKGIYYQNGDVNNAFNAFLQGLAAGRQFWLLYDQDI